jgi:hypothetical protein
MTGQIAHLLVVLPEFCTVGLPTLGVPNLAMFR